jgi:hypothetical protein
MSPKTITDLTARGACAGDRLVEVFNCSGGIAQGDELDPLVCRWNDHRFARFRTAMAVLDRYLREIRRGYTAPVDLVTTPYPARIAEGDLPPYALPDPAIALETTSSYVDLVAAWEDAAITLDDEAVPRPGSTLRAVPPV